jgi:hypothetical protein
LRNSVKLALRGAVGFGVGPILTIALLILESSIANARADKTAPVFMFYAIIASVALSGALGAAALTWKAADAATMIRGAIGFAGGFLVMSFGQMFTLISIQGGGRPEYGWGAIGFGVSFAIGAGIGTLFLRPSLAPVGALAFGIPGAASGALLFKGLGVLLVYNPDGAKAIAAIVTVVGFLLPYVVGGAVLGAALGFAGRD